MVADRKNVEFKVLTVMTVKSTILDVLPYIPVEVHIRFGGMYCFHLQGQKGS
jgi:hypothetical protein